ncbi:hypothetical protein [Bellilinea sp.]|jgi:hypothetical protein|uniref:hypothetical protein n=1 Tax=Bellilinea sp. TaxID=2838785 RepID=UPI002ADE6148|nr:hypothetical protein [Bellilinea sp.]
MTNLVGLQLNESHSSVDFQSIADAGADFVTIYIGGQQQDGKPEFISPTVFADMVQRAYDAGLIIGVRFDLWVGYWLQTNRTMADVEKMTDSQHPIISQLISLLRYKAISFLSIGVYEMSLSTSAGEVTDSWLAFALRDVVDRLERLQRIGTLLPFKIGVYSRENFTAKYPSLDTFVASRPDLYIHAPKWIKLSAPTSPLTTDPPLPSNQPVFPTLRDLITRYVIMATPPKPFGWSDKRAKEWSFWDLGTQEFLLNGEKVVAGYEMYNGTRENFNAEINPRIKPTPIPPAEPEPTPEPEPDTLKQILGELQAIRQILSERL